MRLLSGYLTFVNEGNTSYRKEFFRNSLASLSRLETQSDVIAIDNHSIPEVRQAIRASGVFKAGFFLDANYYDVSLFYLLYWYAQEHGYPYLLYLYDDFLVYDDDFVPDAIRFMEEHRVEALRVVKYDFAQRERFDARVTPKTVNPDAVLHINYRTGEELDWRGPFPVGRHTFYTNNWHYNSRPMIWKTESFGRLLGGIPSSIPVLQSFEEAAETSRVQLQIGVGVMDRGAMETSRTECSAREKVNFLDWMRVRTEGLRRQYELLKQQNFSEPCSPRAQVTAECERWLQKMLESLDALRQGALPADEFRRTLRRLRAGAKALDPSMLDHLDLEAAMASILERPFIYEWKAENRPYLPLLAWSVYRSIPSGFRPGLASFRWVLQKAFEVESTGNRSRWWDRLGRRICSGIK